MQIILGETAKQGRETEVEIRKCDGRLGLWIFFLSAGLIPQDREEIWVKTSKGIWCSLSEPLLLRLTAHTDQRLLSNKLSGPKTWHRHLVSCWQRFAAPAPAVTQSPY